MHQLVVLSSALQQCQPLTQMPQMTQMVMGAVVTSYEHTHHDNLLGVAF